MCKTSSQHYQTPPKLQNGLQTLYIYTVYNLTTIYQSYPRLYYLRFSTLAPVISESRWQVLQTPPLLWGWCASGGLCAERALLRSLGLALLTAQMSSAKKKWEVEGCCLAPSIDLWERRRNSWIISWFVISHGPAQLRCSHPRRLIMGTSCISVQIPCCKPKQNLHFSQVYQPWSGKIEHSLSQTDPSNNPAFNGFAAFWTPKYMPPMPIPIKFLSGPHSGKSGPFFQTLYVQGKASQLSWLRDPSNCKILMSIVYRYIHDTNPSCWLLGYRPFWWFTYFSITMENKKGALSIMGSRWVLAAEITPEVPEVRMGCIFSDGFRWI